MLIGQDDPANRFVMPGVDPGIRAVPLPPASTRNLHGHGTRHPVDARVKPGHDGYRVAVPTERALP
jgi:hypothetical protein